MALLASTVGFRSRAVRPALLPAWCAFLWLVATPALAAPPAATPEYQLKAVFLFNFAQFVEWPAAGFPVSDAPLVIGVLGTDPFGSALDEVVRGEAVGPHRLEVRRYTRVEEVGPCQILFIGASEAGRLEQIANRLQNRPILTVSDLEGSALRGVMIRFVPENGRIRLRINLEAARQAGLQVSSKLLRRAEIVGKREQL
jgi:hypothetical protein